MIPTSEVSFKLIFHTFTSVVSLLLTVCLTLVASCHTKLSLVNINNTSLR